MQRVFINALSAKSGGGKSILTNFLSILSKNNDGRHYFVLVPKVSSQLLAYSCEYISILELPLCYTKTIMFPLVNRWILPRLVHKKGCGLIFNLADVPMPVDVKQIFLFDWAYAVFPDSPVWGMMDIRSWVTRKAKLYYFKKYLQYVDLVIAQTPVMKKRLRRLYDLHNIKIVPNAVSLDSFGERVRRNFQLGDSLNLLYLTYYYPHKNLEIFLPLAHKIKSRNKKIRIITTITAGQHPKAAKFLRDVESQGLQDVIHNIGSISMKDVPSLYEQSDGLLMPTLLESFSGTYVEAMFHRKPIFTSDLDFARGICQDAAYYFDPFCPDHIFDKIMEYQRDKDGGRCKIDAGKKVLDGLMTWPQAFDVYVKLFEETLQEKI